MNRERAVVFEDTAAIGAGVAAECHIDQLGGIGSYGEINSFVNPP